MAVEAGAAAAGGSLMPYALAGNAIAQIGGNLIGGYYADKAAEKQAKAAQEALNFKKMVWNEAKQRYEPYIEAGQRGLTGYEKAITDYTQPTLGYTQKDFNFQTLLDPGAQYRMDQAKKAIEASMASKGQSLGSGVLKSLQTRSQDMASQEYDKAFDRWQKESQMRYGQSSDQYGRDINFRNQNIQNYGGLAGIGKDAIAGTTTAAGGIGDSMLQVGQAQGLGDVNKANMWTSSAQSLGKGFSDYLLELEKQKKAG